jgi:hypothetical protein
MKTVEIQSLIEREPFRPFSVRLSNGVLYSFYQPREIGAPRDYHIIVFFDDTRAVRIDTENIVEIIEHSLEANNNE